MILNIDSVLFNIPEFKDFNFIFCESYFHYRKFRKACIKRKNLFISGYPVFDLIEQSKFKQKDMITYWSRWSLDQSVVKSTFLTYYNFIINLASNLNFKVTNIRMYLLLMIHLEENKYFNKKDIKDFYLKCKTDNVHIENVEKITLHQ